MYGKQTTLVQRLPVWGGGELQGGGDGGMKRGSEGSGSGRGGGWGNLSLLLPLPPEALADHGSWSPRLGKLLSLSIQLGPWEKRQSVRKGQRGSRQRGSWRHEAISLEFPPILQLHPRHRR